MVKRLSALVLLVAACALVVVSAVSAEPTTPTSPGACHMLEANAPGLAGMDGSHGGKNMVPLVFASLGAGCTP